MRFCLWQLIKRKGPRQAARVFFFHTYFVSFVLCSAYRAPAAKPMAKPTIVIKYTPSILFPLFRTYTEAIHMIPGKDYAWRKRILHFFNNSLSFGWLHMGFLSSVAGLSSSFPSSPKREPWQGQSQLCSAGLYFKAQPMWGQRGTVGVSRFKMASTAFAAS